MATVRVCWIIAAGLALSSACTTLLGGDKDYYEATASPGSSGGGGPDGGGPDGGGGTCALDACVCPDGARYCAGACVDTATDPRHCGACGHDCQGGACEASACQPVVLAQGFQLPAGIALDAERVYWTEQVVNGSVAGMPKGGGEPTVVLAAREHSPWAIAAGGAYVYWSSSMQSSLWRSPRDRGEPVEFLKRAKGGALAIDSRNLYWADPDRDAIGKAPLAGAGAPQELAAEQGDPFDIAVDATHVYWTVDTGSSGLVRRAPIEGGPAESLASMEGAAPRGIAVDATHVYWVDQGGAVHKTTREGGGEHIEIVRVGSEARSVAVDAAHVYWTAPADGAVRRVPLDGGAVETFAGDQGMPWEIAVDETSVYWTTHTAGGGVTKRAK